MIVWHWDFNRGIERISIHYLSIYSRDIVHPLPLVVVVIGPAGQEQNRNNEVSMLIQKKNVNNLLACYDDTNNNNNIELDFRMTPRYLTILALLKHFAPRS